MAKALYAMGSSIPSLDLTDSPPLELMHTSPGLKAARGNQVFYQKQFVETVREASEKIKRESFDAILGYIASRRHEMAKASDEWPNLFGIRRPDEDIFHTDMIGPYEKYRDLFLKSDKQKWKLIHVSSMSYCCMAYQIEVTPKGKETPIQLTRIQPDVFYGVDSSGVPYNVRPGTSWFHTSTKNIEPALKEAERIFKDLPDPQTIEHTAEGLETVMKAVGELHWWLAQACPYRRGSAAIAKMMACAVLKHYGIEAGGFGSTEPDCMALIQFPDEFIENYSKLMVAPPPHWVEKKGWFKGWS